MGDHDRCGGEVGEEADQPAQYEVLLVDRRVHHELKPMIPEAVGEWIDCDVRVPIRKVLAPYPVSFREAEVLGVDLRARRVETDGGTLKYWRLVWGLGGEPDLSPGNREIPGLREWAIAPYDEEQACRLRRQVGGWVRYAATRLPPAERRPFLTVVVAGGGFVGVEMAGELADRLAVLARRYGLKAEEPRVLLVEPQSRLLAGFDSRLSRAVYEALRAKGIEVRFGVGVARVGQDHVVLDDGSRVLTRTVVWAGGVRGRRLARTVGLPTDARDRIRVDDRLRVLGHPEVYALGDAVALPFEMPLELTASAQAAVHQARFVAKALLMEMQGQSLQRLLPYRPRGRGVVVLVGHREAIARVGPWAPLRPLARYLKPIPLLEHLWRLGGPSLVARFWGSLIFPLIVPNRVDRYRRAGDRPLPEPESPFQGSM